MIRAPLAIPVPRVSPRSTALARTLRAAFCASLLAAAGSSGPAAADTQIPDRFVDQLVVTGLNDPVGFAFLPDGRIILVERSGPVRLVSEGKLGAVDPLLVVDSVDFSGDRGLTGVAIDPRWPAEPYVYVYYDALDGYCRITRYTAGGDLDQSSSLFLTLDPGSRYDVLNDIPDLLDLHNGGTVRFGPDSMMYAALGEDGFGCAAQDTVSLRGVMIRIDVRGLPPGPGGPPDKDLLVPPDNPLVGHPQKNARLVWATGMRNPFRFHFDTATGDIFLGDVGFSLFEEVDVISGPMPNFGWPYYEGPATFVTSCPGIVPDPNLTPPIYSYDRTGFTASVIGGGVYHAPCTDCGFPVEYDGDYFLSDFYEGFLRRLKKVDGQWMVAPPVAGQPNSQDWGRGFREVGDYQVGPDGALWYCRMSIGFEGGSGEIGRIVHENPVADAGPRNPSTLSFAPAYPTPSRGPVRLSFALPAAGRVELAVYDPQGRVSRRLLPAGTRTAGRHTVEWDGLTEGGEPAASGIYLARLVVDGRRLTRRIVLTR